MSIKDNIGNAGLYRLWVVLFWGWIIGFLALGGMQATKREYEAYERRAYCERMSIAEGREPTDLNLACGIKVKSGEARIPHNGFLLMLWVALALLAPPFALYYLFRIGRWVMRGFTSNQT